MRPTTIFTSLAVVVVLVLAAGLAVGQDQPAQKAQITTFVSVTQPIVNLREGPGVNFEILGKVYSGHQYRVLTRTKSWVKIRHTGLGDGWLSASLATFRAETTYVAVAATSTPRPVASVTEDKSTPGWLLPGLIVLLALVLISSVLLASRGQQHEILHHHG